MKDSTHKKPLEVLQACSKRIEFFNLRTDEIIELVACEYADQLVKPLQAKIMPLEKLFNYAGKYEITIQFWGEGNTNVFIEKGSIPLTDFGGLTHEEAINKTVEYLDRINKK